MHFLRLALNLGVDEDVVDPQFALGDVWNWGRVGSGGIIGGCETDVLQDLVGLSELHGDESLTVGDGDGGDGKSGVLVEPEQKGHPQVKSGLLSLRGLKSVEERNSLTNSGSASAGGLAEALVGLLLADKTIPTNALVGGNKEGIMEGVDIAVILIQRVSVNGELGVANQTLTNGVTVGQKGVTGGRIVGGHGSKSHVQNHIMEEISKLHCGEVPFHYP